MRTVIFMSGVMIAEAINYNYFISATKKVKTFAAIVLLVAIVMDIVEFFKK